MGWLFESPFFLILIIVLVVSWIVGKTKGKMKESETNKNKPISDIDSIGDQDEVVTHSGYYYYQEDNQPVIKRSEEQQRIVDEYFIIKNYKTVRCKSDYKKKHKFFNMLGTVLLIVGLVMAGFFLIREGFSLEYALESAGFIIGLVIAVGGVGSKIAAHYFKKEFEKSVNVSVAPKKVMTDSEYELLVNQKIADMNIEELGLCKLGLDPEQIKEIRPIILRDKVIDGKCSLTSRNKDGSVHSSTQHVTYLYFTDDQLFVYKIQFDMCCNLQKEWASEYFYKDICDVSSYTSVNVLKFNHIEYEYSTVAFNIIATNSEIGFELDGDNENIMSIQAMKQKIREKKAQ